jgi:hypothetical protein
MLKILGKEIKERVMLVSGKNDLSVNLIAPQINEMGRQDCGGALDEHIYGCSRKFHQCFGAVTYDCLESLLKTACT